MPYEKRITRQHYRNQKRKQRSHLKRFSGKIVIEQDIFINGAKQEKQSEDRPSKELVILLWFSAISALVFFSFPVVANNFSMSNEFIAMVSLILSGVFLFFCLTSFAIYIWKTD